MKRFIYSIIAFATVVGCTKSNLVEGPQSMGTPIEFETYNGRIPVTKALEINDTSIQTDGFHVTAFYDATEAKYMDSNVKWKNSSWEYSPKAYWPATGDLDFVAYGLNADKKVNDTDILSVTNYTELTYTVPDVVSEQEDLVASQFGTSSRGNDNVVTIQMKHLLSRIGFQVKTIYTGQAPSAEIKIKNITLKGTFKRTGEINLKPGTEESFEIQPTEESTTVSSYSLFSSDDEYFTAGANANAQPIFCNAGLPKITDNSSDADKQTVAAAMANRYMMLMPGSMGTNPSVEVEYMLTGQTGYQKAVIELKTPSTTEGVSVPWTLAAGTAYEFIFTVSISSIDFTGEIVDWDEEHDDYIQNI